MHGGWKPRASSLIQFKLSVCTCDDLKLLSKARNYPTGNIAIYGNIAIKFCLFDWTVLSCFAYNRKFFQVALESNMAKSEAEFSIDELRKPRQVKQKKNAEKTDCSSQLVECYDSRVVNLHTYGVESRIFKFTLDSYLA